MTLTLSYDPTLSRVVIQGTALPDGFVRVERSVNELMWEVVRGGFAVEIESGSFTLYDYEFFDSVDNFYRIVEAVSEEFIEATDTQASGESWQVPIGVNQLTFEMWGGGGSGQGNGPPNTISTSRPGGGGGGYAASTIPVSSGETLSIRIGEGGSPDSQLIENDGASSFVKRGNSILVEALGGSGASGFTTPGLGGDAGLGVGQVLFSGGDGGVAQSETTAGGGGGGSATDSGDGSNGAAGALGIGGLGGAGEGSGGSGGAQPPGMRTPGVSGSNATTPDNAALDITGDLDLRALISLDDWTPSAQIGIMGKWTLAGNQRSYLFAMNTTGNLQLYTSTDGVASVQAASTVPISIGAGPLAVRVTIDVNNGAAGRTITFYVSPNLSSQIDGVPSDVLNSGPWYQLGSPVIIATAITLFSSSAPLEMGSFNAGANTFPGIFHAGQVRNGIGGTVAADPNFGGQVTDTTSFADSAGRTWTVNGTARVINESTVGMPGVSPGGGGGGQGSQQVYSPNTAASGDGAPGQLNIRSWPDGDGAVGTEASITPDLQGEVWLKSIKYPFLNRVLECTPYSDIQRPARTSLFDVSGRSMPIAVHDLRGSRSWTITALTRTLEDARNMDLTLAANPLFFIHVPKEDPETCGRVSAVPGGYVSIGDTVQHRAYPGSQIYSWDLPCTEVAKPDPQIVGTTLIWATVLNRYGSWEALIASNPTWLDLFQQVSSPEDLVVL
jgi:hypothetical protein